MSKMALQFSSFEPLNITKRSVLTIFASLLIAAPLLFSAPSQAKAPTGAEKHVNAIANQVIYLAKSGSRGNQLHGRFLKLLAKYANMKAVGKFALGRYRKKLPPQHAARYNKLVKAYIAGVFVFYADDFRGTGHEIRSTRKSGRSVIIKSRIKFSSKSSPVEWRVYSSGNRHRVTDVKLRGVWMSILMRDKFTKLLRRNNGDFNALLKFLGTYKNWMPKG